MIIVMMTRTVLPPLTHDQNYDDRDLDKMTMEYEDDGGRDDGGDDGGDDERGVPTASEQSQL